MKKTLAILATLAALVTVQFPGLASASNDRDAYEVDENVIVLVPYECSLDSDAVGAVYEILFDRDAEKTAAFLDILCSRTAADAAFWRKK